MTSLVTRCPQCRAAFRVVAEQLHLRNGKVRCGVCNAVFDARAHQEQAPEPIVPQAPAEPPRPPVVAEPLARHDPPKRHDSSFVGRQGATTSAFPPAGKQPPATTPKPAPASVPPHRDQPSETVQAAAQATPPRAASVAAPPAVATSQPPSEPDDSGITHVEPWLSEDAIVPPVSTQAGRLREPVMGAASQPTVGADDKREPVFTAGATPSPAPAGVPERRDPQLHEQGGRHHQDDGFGDDDGFDDHDGFDEVSHEPEEHHDPDTDHERGAAQRSAAQRDAAQRGLSRPLGERSFSARPLTTPASGSRSGAARPVETRPNASRPGAARPFVAQSPAVQTSATRPSASRSSSSASSTPPFVARPLSAPHDEVRTHREPVMAARGQVAHEPVHDADDFVAHGPRSGYAVDLRGARHGGLARVFWSVCCILAGLALVLQALWWWRTPIATHVPAMRPVYEAVCAGLDCRVGYVRVPGLLSIESSSIQPQALSQPSDKAQHMTLSAVLRNRASHAQPWPAIELTLTDFANVVVARRMLLPTEYLGSDAPVSFTSNTEREIAVALSVRGAPVSGYRLALFFP